jgi:hypothetical protein
MTAFTEVKKSQAQHKFLFLERQIKAQVILVFIQKLFLQAKNPKQIAFCFGFLIDFFYRSHMKLDRIYL